MYVITIFLKRFFSFRKSGGTKSRSGGSEIGRLQPKSGAIISLVNSPKTITISGNIIADCLRNKTVSIVNRTDKICVTDRQTDRQDV